MNHPNRKKSGGTISYMDMGLGLGAGLGVALGSAFDNISMGLVLGMCLGISLGAFIDYLTGRDVRGRRAGAADGSQAGEADSGGPSQIDRERANSIIFQFAAGIFGFSMLMMLSILYLGKIEQPAAKVLVAVLPIVPAYLAIRAVSKLIASMDELQRSIQFESLALTLAGTLILALVLGMLETAGLPHLNWGWLALAICLLWVVSQVLVSRKYR
jgi:hypothetical protein